jgi:alkylated DNA repair dioxygenase AlkB
MTQPGLPLEHPGAEHLYLPEGRLTLYRRVVPDPDGLLLARLIDAIAWRQEQITLFGKSHPQPRLSAWYGDPDASYRYSGLDNTPVPWTGSLQLLRRRVQDTCGHCFNSVLLNYYRDGADAMGMHADDEPELGPEPVIASLSLGATRRMRFVHQRRLFEPLALELEHGSLLLMAGATQRNWKHGISRTRRACGPRVNLTFRQVMPSRAGD